MLVVVFVPTFEENGILRLGVVFLFSQSVFKKKISHFYEKKINKIVI